MSDGGADATLDHRRAAQPSLGAAPWERFSEPPSDHGVHGWQAESPPAEPIEPIEPIEPLSVIAPDVPFPAPFESSFAALSFATFFRTGTRSIEQIGHFPGVLECTEGCIVQV